MSYRLTLTWYFTLARDAPAAGLHLVGTPRTYLFDRLQPGRGCADRITIGRYTGGSLHIQDPYASVRHAYVARRPDGTWEIGDRGSRNGVWVDGTRIQAPTALTAGMHVRIGSTRFIAVNRYGLVPITACTVGAFCFLLFIVYGGFSEAARRMGHRDVQREFIRAHAEDWLEAQSRPQTP